MAAIILRPLLYILIICSLSCHNTHNTNGHDVCDWTNYLEGINKQQGSISLHPSENGFKPALKTSSSVRGLKLMLQDFRQFEFVSESYKPIILSDLDSIKKIKTDNIIKSSSDFGLFDFNKVYIRNRIANPIDTTLTLSDLRNIFAKDFLIDSLIITNCDLKWVERGFSFILNGIPFYGVTNDKDQIMLLGILEVAPKYDTKENHDKIKKLLVDKRLLLIAWNSESVLTPEDFQ